MAELPEWLRARYQDGTIRFYSAGYFGMYDGNGGFTLYKENSDTPTDINDIPNGEAILANIRKAQTLAEPELVINPTAQLLLNNDTPTSMIFGWGQVYLDLKPKEGDPYLTSDLSKVHVQSLGLTITAPNTGEESLIVAMPDNRYREFYSEHPQLAETQFISIMRKELGQSWDWREGIQAAKAQGIDINDPTTHSRITLASRFASEDTAKADRDYHQSPLYQAFEAELIGFTQGDKKGARAVTADPETLGKVGAMMKIVESQYAAYQRYFGDRKTTYDEFKLMLAASGRALTFDCNGGVGCIVTYDKTTGKWAQNQSYGDFYKNFYNNLHSGPWQLVEMLNNVQVFLARTDQFITSGAVHPATLTTSGHLMPSEEAIKLAGFLAPHLTASYVGLDALPLIVRASIDPKLLTAEVQQGGSWLKELREAAISAGIVPVTVRERPVVIDKALDGTDDPQALKRVIPPERGQQVAPPH